MMKIQGATVLVAGMAKSGLAAIQLLKKRGAARIIATDTKPFDAETVGADEFRLQSPEAWQGVDLIVLSPGVPLSAVPTTKTPVIGDLELAGQFLKGRTIGITGSNGKTTTTSMIGHILRESGIACQVGGNIGVPPAAMVETSTDGQWNVLELSSFQLETIHDFRAHIGVCLNITPDHLDRHGTLEAYAASKRRLFETQTEMDYAVLNADDTICSSFMRNARSQTAWFSLSESVSPPGFCLDPYGALRSRTDFLIWANEIPIRGRHNIENTLAAATAAHLAGATLSQIRAAIMTFKAVEHRLEFVRDWKGIAFYNDSKATNVDAALKAIEAFDGGLWIILGGKDKDSDYTVLQEPLQRTAKGILLIGAAAAKIANQLPALSITQAETLQIAVEIAAAKATPGDTVLLAPACASFDQFDNYEHRGRVFKSLVNSL